MIILVGVGHVFDIGRQVKGIIHEHVPAAVGLELDRNRFLGLQARARGEAKPTGFAARFQERIAKKYGTEVGNEMLCAIETAKTLNAKLAFIDMDASKIISDFWNTMTFKEKVKLVFALFTSVFVRKKRIEKELKKFEENDEYYMDSFGKEFPTAKTVLIDDRNAYMAASITKLYENYEDIVAVVGDGHVEGIRRLLQTPDVEIVRLSQLRTSQEVESDGVTISFQVEYHS